MPMFEYWLESDLREFPIIKSMHGVTFTQDSGDNKIGVVVTDGGEVVTLVGDVQAWIILPSGETIYVDGDKSGNRAWIVLPDDAYEEEGQISIFIKLINDEDKVTLGGIEAYVYKSL